MYVAFGGVVLLLGNHLEHNTSKRMLILAVTEDDRTVENVLRILTHFTFRQKNLTLIL